MGYFAFAAFATELSLGFWNGMAASINPVPEPASQTVPISGAGQTHFLRQTAQLEAAQSVVSLDRVRLHASRR
jgi:hypothetical protein